MKANAALMLAIVATVVWGVLVPLQFAAAL
jgi:hypothetical protein